MNLIEAAKNLPHAWRSKILGRTAGANLKVIRMDEAGWVLCGLIAGKSLGAAVELSMEYSPAAPFGGIAPADASDALINLVKTRLR
ncbi:hypothetical protein [Pseudomonas sp. MWU16-30317]|uniref:hypothetical protein n=1 Tax=Pseudomonas sp. MWU16-30317 TaxID=2878095 RepID=UPI001CFA4F18|nr:hypothetical protein [Pseudomonas sp. MWU16-30317]